MGFKANTMMMTSENQKPRMNILLAAVAFLPMTLATRCDAPGCRTNVTKTFQCYGFPRGFCRLILCRGHVRMMDGKYLCSACEALERAKRWPHIFRCTTCSLPIKVFREGG